MSKQAVFCCSGFPPKFFASEYRNKREKIFKWLKEFGIDGIEILCTYGIKMPDEQARVYKQLAEEYDVYMAMHAPYYINLGSLREEVVENSKNEIKKAYALAEKLGITRIIFHPGGGWGKTEEERKAGLQRLIDALNEIESELDTKDIKVYPEIGGKVNALGSLDEIIEICKKVKYARPCIDFAHLHAREIGSMTSVEKIVEVLKKIEKELGRKMLEETHFHVYPADYTEKGEKSHKVFGEKRPEHQIDMFNPHDEYMPRAEDYIEALKIMDLAPVTVCEAHNTQEDGALLMKQLYNER